MIHWTACAFMGVSLFAGGTNVADSVKKEKAGLQGVWKVTESVSNGEKVPAKDLEDLFIIFRGDSIFIREGKNTAEKFAYSLDPLKLPHEINLTFKNNPNKGREDHGIYLLEGDALRICIQSDKDRPRPRTFTSRPDSNLWLIVMQRTKE